MSVLTRAVLCLALAAAALAAGCSEDTPARKIQRMADRGDVEGLAREAKTATPEFSRMAVSAMARVGPKAEPYVREAMRDSRPEIREVAVLVAPRVAPGKTAPEVAVMAREDPEPLVRSAAVTALGQMVAVDQSDAIFQALLDEDRMVRKRASEAIARMTGRSYDLYVDGPPDKRQQAVAALKAEWPQLQEAARKYFFSKRPAAGS
jgi:HEAT repeat protein